MSKFAWWIIKIISGTAAIFGAGIVGWSLVALFYLITGKVTLYPDPRSIADLATAFVVGMTSELPELFEHAKFVPHWFIVAPRKTAFVSSHLRKTGPKRVFHVNNFARFTSDDNLDEKTSASTTLIGGND